MEQDLIDESLVEERERSRHGCVTAWLVLLIVVNSLVSLSYLAFGEFVKEANTEVIMEDWMLLVLGVASILNVVCAVLLLKWRKVGFWGFAATSLLALVINFMIGLGVGQSLAGLIGIAILYGILQIKKDGDSAWSHLS